MNRQVINILIKSADIVQAIGELKLLDGTKIKDSILISGISLWQVAEPTMAVHIVPHLLNSKSKNPNFKKKIILYLKSIRQIFRNFQFVFNKEGDYFNNKKGHSNWFFLGFTHYIYKDILKPVIQSIQFSSEKIQPLLINNEAGRIKTSRGLINLKYRNQSNYRELKELNSTLLKITKTLKSNELNNIFVQKTGLSKQECNYLFKWLLLVFIPQMLPHIIIARRLISKYKSKLIVSSDVSDPRSRIFCLLGKMANIPILELQFASYEEDSVEWRFSLGDKVAIWGEHAAKVLIDFHGVQKNRLEIIGSPRFDYLKTVSRESFLKLCVKYKISQDAKFKFVLFASTYTLPSYDKIYSPKNLNSFKEKLFEISGKQDDLILLVKPHPVENSNSMKAFASMYKNIIFIDSKEDIREFIPFCDLFVTLGSTSTFDALLFNKIILSANLNNLVWWDDIFVKEKITLCINTYQELENALLTFCTEQQEDIEAVKINSIEFLNRFIYKPDGNASERVICLAKKMLNPTI